MDFSPRHKTDGRSRTPAFGRSEPFPALPPDCGTSGRACMRARTLVSPADVTDAPKAEQDMPGVFVSTVAGCGPADPRLVIPRTAPLHDCLAVGQLGGGPLKHVARHIEAAIGTRTP